jgi:adhesin HecA-like repeat protein
MPIKFPHLKHTTDPLGLIEQIGAAATVPPKEDAAMDGGRSWFGRLLSDDGFTWSLASSHGSKSGKKDDLVGAYFKEEVLYQVYDWQLTSLRIDNSKGIGEATGEVRLKGKNKLCSACELCGDYEFSYQLRRETVKDDTEQNGRWRLTEWNLKEK